LVNKQQTGANLAATFAPDSKYVISCNNMGIVRINLRDNTTQVFTLEEPKHLSNDGTFVACSTTKGWQVQSTENNETLIPLPDTIDRFLVFSRDNMRCAQHPRIFEGHSHSPSRGYGQAVPHIQQPFQRGYRAGRHMSPLRPDQGPVHVDCDQIFIHLTF